MYSCLLAVGLMLTHGGLLVLPKMLTRGGLLVLPNMQVACEDTVLYTLQRYLSTCSQEQQQHARQVLAPLVRCQHLSQFWVVDAVASTKPTHPLAELRPQLMKLLMLRNAQPGAVVQTSDLQPLLAGAPASWTLGRQVGEPVASVSVTWGVSISTLQATTQLCVTDQKIKGMVSPAVTAPLGGLAFEIYLQCTPADAGCELGVFARCNNQSLDSLRPPFKLELAAAGVVNDDTSPVGPFGVGYGWRDFFKLGAMAGGWDAVAVAAKGLPAGGELPITLTVSEVAYLEPLPAPVPAPVGHVGRQRRR